MYQLELFDVFATVFLCREKSECMKPPVFKEKSSVLFVMFCELLFISRCLIRYESSRGHKTDGTKPDQNGNTVGEEKTGKADRGGKKRVI